MSHDLYITSFYISLAQASDTWTLIPSGQKSSILPCVQDKRTEIFVNNPTK